MKKLMIFNRRDLIGCVCWLLASLVIGLWALPAMVAREVWQWRHYRLERLEWWDLVRYGAVIGLGAMVR